MSNWYEIEHIEKVDSPSIVVYKDRLLYNIKQMIAMVGGDTSRLMPHLKTNKMPEVVKLMLGLGINRFKSSTISEAEIAAKAGASSVLIAHQLVGPKVERLASLVELFPATNFATIIDNEASAEKLNNTAAGRKLTLDFFVDINNGMNRSGIEVKNLNALLETIPRFKHLQFKGLHVYDGHLRNHNYALRKGQIEEGFIEINDMFNRIKSDDDSLQLICGGTPSYSSHLLEKNRTCSPGTCLFWDWGYGGILEEQSFKYAALLVTRVISKPTKGLISVDLGHKAVASENPIDKRVKFLNLENYTLLSQSEEHGVIKVENWDEIEVGDVFYGVPYHICPTVNLYDEASIIENGNKVSSWKITARQRRLTV